MFGLPWIQVEVLLPKASILIHFRVLCCFSMRKISMPSQRLSFLLRSRSLIILVVEAEVAAVEEAEEAVVEEEVVVDILQKVAAAIAAI